MKNTFRILFFIAILVGGAYASTIWIKNEFTTAFKPFDNISTESSLNVATVYASLATSTEVIATSTDIAVLPEDLNFSFTSPLKGALLYQGCTYKIGLLASTSIKEIKIALVDVGTRKEVPSSVSLLPEEIKDESVKDISWKVGMRIWPGEYFLRLSSLNTIAVDEKSYRFTVTPLTEGQSNADQQKLCAQSGGSL